MKDPASQQQPLIIFGAGILARLLHYYMQAEQLHTISAFVADREYIKETHLDSLPLIGADELEARFPPSDHNMIIAVGHASMRLRQNVYERYSESDYKLVNYISDQCRLTEETGTNNIIMPGAHIEPFTHIGSNNIIWSGAHICHGTHLGDHNFIAANSTIGGNVTAGNGCFFGLGSVTLNDLNIGDETLVGAGAVIIRNTVSYGRYRGVPAELTGTHEEHGIQV